MDKVKKNKILVKFHYGKTQETQETQDKQELINILKALDEDHREFLKALDAEFEKVSQDVKNIPLKIKRIHYLIKNRLMTIKD